MKEEKDKPGTLDVATKIIGGIALPIITFLLVQSNNLKKDANALKQQEIDNSMKYGAFAQTLIKDLLVRDSSELKSDLTFITLNRTIGDKDSILISELGIRLIKDFYKTQKKRRTDSIQLASNADAIQTVETIVNERDSAAYKRILAIRDEYNRLNKLDTLTTAKKLKMAESLRKGAKELKANDPTSIAGDISPELWAKLTLVPSNGTVFIQVNGGKNSAVNGDWANILRGKISYWGFNTPGIEVISAYSFPNLIRYYYDSDKPAAEKLKAEMDKILPTPINTQSLINTSVRRGTIELWVNR